MSKRLICLMTLSLACPLQWGCGDAASNSTAYDEALEKLAVAQQGFVPSSGEGGGPTLAAFRQESLTEAGEALDEVIASGSPAQKVGAYRLRAHVDASAARHAAREAASHYAQLAPQAIQRASHALAADRAQARAADRGGDQTPLLQSLRQMMTRQQERRTELVAQAEQLRAELGAKQQEKAQIQSRRDASAARVSQLRNQAFVARGEEQFRLQEEAAGVEREGTLAAAELARTQLDIDMINSRLGVIDSQLQLADKLLADLQSRLEQTQARQSELEQGLAAAEQARQQELQQLADAYNQIWDTFETQVNSRLAEAAEQTALAVNRLEEAGGIAGSERSAVQLDLLGALTTRAEILVEHLQTLAGFRDILELVAQTAGDQADPFQQRIDRLRQEGAAIAESAVAAIERGRTAAQQAMAGGSMDVAQQRASRLEAYAAQVQRLTAGQ